MRLSRRSWNGGPLQQQGSKSDEIVSTAHLDKRPSGQLPQVEIWGAMPEPAVGDGEAFLNSLEEADGGEEHADPDDVVLAGHLLDCELFNQLEVTSISCGCEHAVFLIVSGQAFAYGNNERGQLGVGSSQFKCDQPTPMRPLRAQVQAPVEPVSPSDWIPRRSTRHGTRSAAGPYRSVLRGGGTVDAVAEQSEECSDWTTISVACGAWSTLLLARHSNPGESQNPRQRLFGCGGSLGVVLCLDMEDDDQDIHEPHIFPDLLDVTAVAARGDASCCAAAPPEVVSYGGHCAGGVPGDRDGDHASPEAGTVIYYWGEVRCLTYQTFIERPEPALRLPEPAASLGLGESFGLALDTSGRVYAWGDNTYGELGGAVSPFGETGTDQPYGEEDLPIPGRVRFTAASTARLENRKNRTSRTSQDNLGMGSRSFPSGPPVQPTHSGSSTSDKVGAGATSSTLPDGPQQPKVVALACGERHSLLLDEDGYVYAFGENFAGQCGVADASSGGHSAGVVPRPWPVHLEGPRPPTGTKLQTQERGEKVFAGRRHSACVTRDGRLYVWGHPSNRKLGHAGFNPDGTEAGENPSKERPPGVAVRSPLRDAVRRPRLMYSLIHRNVRTLGLGSECTIIYSAGDVEEPQSMAVESSREIKEWKTEELPNFEDV